MTAQFARAGYQSRPSSPIQHNPQAALLIDFDNVTMGIRSDLSKELKNLLNSDIIKGKVAVQRAYADWRRYPQYIVPLAEASVDLIFAPAYGSSKKNATDIRLAIDALELVFTRGEIGTFILLSGDSDFSSLVLKLKEYGKYVIGVGIRESASDLLVQNCDEYYSYNALTGLTKTTDEMPMGANDPWELVDIAVRQMADGNDVMRSDRLKQVLVELDPNFDEKSLGFSKFNRFLQEAAKRGLLMLQKMENGQYEVAVPSAEQVQAKAEARAEEDRGEGRRSRRGGRGRGRRDGGRDSRRDEERVSTPAPAPAESAAASSTAPVTAAQDVPDQPDVAAAPEAEPAQAEASPAGREASEPPRAPARRTSEPAATPASAPVPGLNGAYVLLRRAVKDASRNGVARDSDVKRRMLEVEPDFDEASFGFSKFSRFLRQAHEDRVVDVQKIENGGYDVMLGEGEPVVVVEQDEREERGRRGRGRRGEGRERKPARETAEAGTPPDSADRPREQAVEAPREAPAAPAIAASAPPAERPAAATPSAAAPTSNAAAAQPPARPLGMRRGSRGRPAPSGPPPLLEGQTVGPAKSSARSESAAAAAPPQAEPPAKQDAVPATAAAAAAEPQPKGPPAERSGRERAGKSRGPAKTAGSAPTAAKAPRAAPPARKQAAAPRGLDAGALGLPSQPVEVVSYLATNYKGIGQKMAESLVEAFGGAGVFEGLQRNPDRVKEILGTKRGEKLLEAWHDDYAFRLANQTDPAQVRKEPAARTGRPSGRPSGPRREGGGDTARKSGGEGGRKGGGRTRRGGRKRPGPKKTG